jgi:type I restriction enzyme S subunit
MVNSKSLIQPSTLPIIENPLGKDILNWTSVGLNEVQERGGRLEASVFGVEGRRAREQLRECGWPIALLCGVDGLADAYSEVRFKRIFVKNSLYPIFQPSQITELSPKPSAFISSKTQVDINNLRVHKNQILLTCSGTIGNCTLVSSTLDNHIFSHDLIRINAKNIEDVGVIYTFLLSKTGKIILNTNNYGAIISHIEPDHLIDVPVPVPSPEIKQEIQTKIMLSFQLRDESNALIDEAQEILKKELNFTDIDEIRPNYFDSTTDIRNYSVPISKLDNRFDPSYHVPIVDAIKDHLKNVASEVTTIGDHKISQNIISPGRFKRVYMKEGQGVVFFGGKQLYDLDPSNKKYLSLKHHEKRIKYELTLRQNMILITCSGTIGKVNITPKHWDGWTANQHIIRVVPASDDIAGYLYIWLSSEFAYPLITRFTYGSVVDEIDEGHIKQIPVPLLKDPNKQKNINDLALKANLKRTEAYLLEQEALDIMNEKIIHHNG